MDNCVFCKIIKGEIPCDKIYEDENFLSFLDIQPVSDGHLLIIPKKHIVWMHEADDETIAGIFKLAKKLMIALKKEFKPEYVQLSISGDEVKHFHIHLFARYLTDGFARFPHKKYENGSEIAKKIIAGL